MAEFEDLLPPPPKKQTSKVDVAEDLLPPPPKKKTDVTTTTDLSVGGNQSVSEVQSTTSDLFQPLTFSEKVLEIKNTPAPQGKYAIQEGEETKETTREDILAKINDPDFLQKVKKGSVNLNIQDDEAIGNMLAENVSKTVVEEPKFNEQEIQQGVDFYTTPSPMDMLPDRFKQATNSFMSAIGQGIASLPKSIGILAKKLDFFDEYKNKEAKDLATYKAGQYISDLTQELFPTNPQYQDEFVSTVLPSGAGSIVTQIGSAFVNPALPVMIGSASMGAPEYEAALQATGDEDKAFDAWKWNAVIGTSEAILPMLAVSKINKATGGGIKNILKEGFKGSLTEGLQEAGSQMATNYTAQQIYDTSRTILNDDVWKSGAAGFILGGFTTGAIETLNKRIEQAPAKEKAELQVTKDFIEKKVNEVQSENYVAPKTEADVKIKEVEKDIANPAVPIEAKQVLVQQTEVLKEEKKNELNQKIDEEFNEFKAEQAQEKVKKLEESLTNVSEASKQIIQEQINAEIKTLEETLKAKIEEAKKEEQSKKTEEVEKVDNKTKQQLLDERLNEIKDIRNKAEGTREERTKRYNELVNELGDEESALKKLQEEINAKAKKEIDKLPELPKTENEIINEKGEIDFVKIKKELGFKDTDLKWGDKTNPFGDDMGDMLLSDDKQSVVFIKPNEVEIYDEESDMTDTITNGVRIELVSTKKESRGNGKAKKLIKKITDWADKNNTDLYLDIVPQDEPTTEVGLKKLYESFGFEFKGISGVRKPKEQIVEPKIEEDAKEQQSGEMRGESQQIQPERKSDSDMPIVNEAELQDREAVEEEVKKPKKEKKPKEKVIDLDRRKRQAEQFKKNMYKYGNIDVVDPYTWIISFFAGGRRMNTKAFSDLTGWNANDALFAVKDDGMTVDEMMSEIADQMPAFESYDVSAFKNDLTDIIQKGKTWIYGRAKELYEAQKKGGDVEQQEIEITAEQEAKLAIEAEAKEKAEKEIKDKKVSEFIEISAEIVDNLDDNEVGQFLKIIDDYRDADGNVDWAKIDSDFNDSLLDDFDSGDRLNKIPDNIKETIKNLLNNETVKQRIAEIRGNDADVNSPAWEALFGEAKPIEQSDAQRRQAEREYEVELKQLEQDILNAKVEKQKKLNGLSNRAELFGEEKKADQLFGASQDLSQENIDAIMKPYNEKIAALEKQRNDFVDNKEKYLEKYKGQQEIKHNIDDEIQKAKDDLKKLFKGGENIGFAFDPKREAEIQYNIHKTLVTLAKLYIQKGMNAAQDFANELGLRLSDIAKAWSEANGGKEVTQDDLAKDPYDINYIRQNIDVAIQAAQNTKLEQDAVNAIGTGTTNFSDFDSAMKGNPNYDSLPDSSKQALYYNAVSIYSNSQAIAQAQQPVPLINLKDQTILEKIKTAFQDKMTRLKDVQKQMEAAGVIIYDQLNAALKYELLIGKSKAKIDDKFQDIVKSRDKKNPALLERLVNDGGDPDELGIYMYALHAPERNAAVAMERQNEFSEAVKELNDKIQNATNPAVKTRFQNELNALVVGIGKVKLLPDGGSGMTNQQAQEIIDAVEQSGKKDLYDKYAEEFRVEVIKPTLQQMFDYGLITKEQFDTLQTKYKHYVPLQVVEKALAKRQGGAGKGGSIKGKDIFRAKGSDLYNYTERYNPLMSSMFAFNNTVIRGEKNEAAKALLNLAKEDKQNEIFEIHKPQYTPIVNSNGEVSFMLPTTPKNIIDNAIELKVDGKPVYVEIKDLALRNAIQEQGIHRGIRGLNIINSWLRNTATLMNPEFIFTNFARDFETALINIQSETKDLNIKDATKFIANPKNIIKAGKGLIDDYKNNHNSDWAKAAKEYRDSGGQVSWFQKETLDEYVNDVNREIKKIKKGEKMPNRVLNAVGETLFLAQSTVEQSIRLATFKALRDRGVSAEKAASAAKNITVNFESKGNWSGVIDSLYLFANAGIQGSYRMAVALSKSPKARGAAATLFAAGILEAAMNDMFGGEDNEDEQISDSIKERNFVIVNPSDPSDPYFKFPLAYGANVFKYAGNLVYDVSTGRKSALDASAKLMLGIYNQFIPIQGATISQALSPTFLDPMVQDIENRNFFDSPLRPESNKYMPPKKESDLYFQSVRPISKDIATWLNNNTGGSAVEAGAIDVSPETIDHYYDAFTGGTGRFIANTGTTTKSLFTEDEIKLRNMPFVRSFVGDSNEKRSLTYIYETFDKSAKQELTEKELEKLDKEIALAIKSGSMDEQQANRLKKVIKKGQAKIKEYKGKYILEEKDKKKGMRQGMPKNPMKSSMPSNPMKQ